MLNIDLFDFELPEELIAQYPVPKREMARLLVLHKKTGVIEHRVFKDIILYFKEGDLLVLNKTKVIKARLYGRRDDTGGKLEFLVTRIFEERRFEALAKPGRRAKQGVKIRIGKDILLEIKEITEGKRIVEIKHGPEIYTLLDKYGKVPLPPYIKREPREEDEEWYQTVFAEIPGSIAAPTAGLHFTQEILTQLKQKGVLIEHILLHVGTGTFKPIKTKDITQHKMDAEYYEIPERVLENIVKMKQSKGRLIACGTTTVRALESWGYDNTRSKGWTSLFIYPDYSFKVVDGMVTNFHLPKSTPLLMVSALAGRENIMKAYKEAVALKYRFFSYGDAMLIIP